MRFLDGSEFHNAPTGLAVNGGDVTITGSSSHDNTENGISQSSGAMTVSYGTYRHQPYGIYVTGGALSVYGAYIGSNTTAGVYVNNATVSLNNNYIENNTSYGVRSGGSLVDAENNYWGDTSGPYNASNTSGTGNPVSSNVDFLPWDNAGVFYEAAHSSVDGGEIRWGGSSAYLDIWNQAVAIWNQEGKVDILPDDEYHIEDLTIYDYSDDESEVVAIYFYIPGVPDVIAFNTANLSQYDSESQLNNILHELGHALGLSHHGHSDDNVMYEYNSTITVLGAQDIATYRHIYGY